MLGLHESKLSCMSYNQSIVDNAIDKLNNAFGAQDAAITRYLATEIERICRADRKWEAVIDGLISLVHEIKPQDPLERLLIIQMLLVNHSVMRQSRTCNSASGEDKESETAILLRLMSMYMKQMECLRKYRHKGEQDIRVTYVQAGQAIVGDIKSP